MATNGGIGGSPECAKLDEERGKSPAMFRGRRQGPPRRALKMWTMLRAAGCGVWLFSSLGAVFCNKDLAYVRGDPSCPCASLEEIGPFDDRDILAQERLGWNTSPSFLQSYGIGCGAHDDAANPACGNNSSNHTHGAFCTPPLQDARSFSQSCDFSWCHRRWCYVNPASCTSLLHRRSTVWKHSDRYVSYATCHEMDSFTKFDRIARLEGRTIKVALNSNSGGWKGAYQAEGQHFALDESSWRGPSLRFVQKAAQQANFSLEIAEPPSFLENRSFEFFSRSVFDLCVYTAALGYVDLCVSSYAITDVRALSTSWFLLYHDPLLLIVHTGETRWSSKMYRKFRIIFQPFTLGAWVVIVLIVIPILGLLLLLHEYGAKESIFPREEEVMVRRGGGNEGNRSAPEILNRPVRPIAYLPKVLYMSFLATMQQSFSASVVTMGGMVHVLGISFFILTIIAVYTANLAAMLTQQTATTAVQNIEEALRAGYRFCGARYRTRNVMDLYNMHSRFVRDPVELGGDGLPGFRCAKCRARVRLFDFLDPVKADTDDRYCHAAIATAEDLEVLHSNSRHCNKTAVGLPVAYVQIGFPIFEGISKELVSLFLARKNEGLFEREATAAKPSPKCPVLVGQPVEDSALAISELIGLWVVMFSFAFLGLLVTWMGPRRYEIWERRAVERWKRSLGRSNTTMMTTQQDSHRASTEIDMDEDQDSPNEENTSVKDTVSLGEALKNGNFPRGLHDTNDVVNRGNNANRGPSILLSLGATKGDEVRRKSVRFVTRLHAADQWGMTRDHESISFPFEVGQSPDPLAIVPLGSSCNSPESLEHNRRRQQQPRRTSSNGGVPAPPLFTEPSEGAVPPDKNLRTIEEHGTSPEDKTTEEFCDEW